MESYLQYRRIREDVERELTSFIEKCNCGAVFGSLHEASCLLARSSFDSIQQDTSSIPADSTDSILLVTWSGTKDRLNPANYSTARKILMTALVSLIALSVTTASAIDACGSSQYSEEFGVSKVVASFPTGTEALPYRLVGITLTYQAFFLVGFAVGSLFAGPFSETFGRNAVYIATMLLYLAFIMAAALAPNLASHLVFRFFAGLFGSTPLSCAGGTVADLWDPVQKTYGFPIYAIPGFGGPMLAQVIGSYIPRSLGWRWLEWITFIMGGAIIIPVALFQPETYGPLLLCWKASILRQKTGDDRYRAPIELRKETLQQRLVIAIYRSFVWSYTEPIIILMSLYLTIVYVILFTFLEGYTYIFGKTYSLSQETTNLVWSGMLAGIILVGLIIPPIYCWTRNEFKKSLRIRPETRLWYPMIGAPIVPISLFWMGWTSNPSISIWSSVIASAFFGFGITTIFIGAYMYVIESYGIRSASALGFLVFTRYLVAGGVTISGRTIYENYGVQYTLTVLGAVSALMAMVPYLLYVYGPAFRKGSTHAEATE